MAMTRSQALARLKLLVASTEEPALTDDEVGTILDAHAVAATWAAATDHAPGDRVIPTAPNGRVYRCRLAGTSGATEPDWGDVDDAYLGRQVEDGDDLVWEDAGPTTGELYDLRAAAHDAWVQKAAACVHQVTFSSSGDQFAMSQRHAQCLRMAERFAPLLVA
jgi:hypothetical protein